MSYPHQNLGWGWYHETSLSPPVIFLLTVPRWCFFCGCFWYVCFSLTYCHVCFLQSCDYLLGKDWHLASLGCDVFLCVFVIFPYSVLGQAWYLIVSIPDLCPLLYLVFVNHRLWFPAPPPPKCHHHHNQITGKYFIVGSFILPKAPQSLSAVFWQMQVFFAEDMNKDIDVDLYFL